eukprot:scaffold9368_cov22-Cyclotella_meneghiniana.AAC.2
MTESPLVKYLPGLSQGITLLRFGVPLHLQGIGMANLWFGGLALGLCHTVRLFDKITSINDKEGSMETCEEESGGELQYGTACAKFGSCRFGDWYGAWSEWKLVLYELKEGGE